MKKTLFVTILLFVSILFTGCATLPDDGSVTLYRVGSQVPEELSGCKYAEINAECNLYWLGLVACRTKFTKIYCKIYNDVFTEVKVYNTRSEYNMNTDSIHTYQIFDNLIGPFKINYIIYAY